MRHLPSDFSTRRGRSRPNASATAVSDSAMPAYMSADQKGTAIMPSTNVAGNAHSRFRTTEYNRLGLLLTSAMPAIIPNPRRMRRAARGISPMIFDIIASSKENTMKHDIFCIVVGILIALTGGGGWRISAWTELRSAIRRTGEVSSTGRIQAAIRFWGRTACNAGYASGHRPHEKHARAQDRSDDRAFRSRSSQGRSRRGLGSHAGVRSKPRRCHPEDRPAAEAVDFDVRLARMQVNRVR